MNNAVLFYCSVQFYSESFSCKKKSMSCDLFKAFDYIESSHKLDFFPTEKTLFFFKHAQCSELPCLRILSYNVYERIFFANESGLRSRMRVLRLVMDMESHIYRGKM
mgnify:CR=1 FL=1